MKKEKTGLVDNAKELMRNQTLKNKAPAWELTEIAIQKAKELSKLHGVDEKLVLVSLYLAHTVFDAEVGGDIQKNHPKASAQFARPYLEQWGANEKDRDIILNAIEAHHGNASTKSKISEIMKNAECFKFVTLKGCLIYLKDLKKRGYSHNEAIELALDKMETKKGLLTLKECKEDAENNCSEIRKALASMKG